MISVLLSAVSHDQWTDLADRAIEPNAYGLPGFAGPVNAAVRALAETSALLAFRDESRRDLDGLIPVTSAWRALRMPLPVLVSADSYRSLGTPFLDRDHADDAARAILQHARERGARALVIRELTLDANVYAAFTHALADDGLEPQILQSHVRACLDATRDADAVLHDALGTKKLKELRRQRHRLADLGEVRFDVAQTPDDVAQALEVLFVLESGGWKGRRGTALAQDDAEASAIRRMAVELGARRQCEIVTLSAGRMPVASAMILRHLDRAFYFKLGIDERFPRMSLGAQLTLELTRHLCADPQIASADSTAAPNHPMIDPIWRGRLPIGDVLFPLYRRDVVGLAVHAGLLMRANALSPARKMVRMLRRLRGEHA